MLEVLDHVLNCVNEQNLKDQRQSILFWKGFQHEGENREIVVLAASQ